MNRNDKELICDWMTTVHYSITDYAIKNTFLPTQDYLADAFHVLRGKTDKISLKKAVDGIAKILTKALTHFEKGMKEGLTVDETNLCDMEMSFMTDVFKPKFIKAAKLIDKEIKEYQQKQKSGHVMTDKDLKELHAFIMRTMEDCGAKSPCESLTGNYFWEYINCIFKEGINE